MRLWWWRREERRKRQAALDVLPEVLPEAHPEEAEEALKAIQAEHKKIEERQPYVDNLSRALARHYNENNFSRLIEEAMRKNS